MLSSSTRAEVSMTLVTAPNVGKIVQAIGPVLDVQFPAGNVPDIYAALRVVRDDGSELIAEVQQHLGNNWVRAVAMSSTDGVSRGTRVEDLGGPITVPV